LSRDYRDIRSGIFGPPYSKVYGAIGCGIFGPPLSKVKKLGAAYLDPLRARPIANWNRHI
jgi:hypothetical protein